MTAAQPGRFVQVESALRAPVSRDLFDFEAAAARTKNFDLPGSAKIARVGGSLMSHDSREPTPPDGEPLLQLCERDGTFWADCATPSCSARSGPPKKRPWLVVKDFPDAGYVLSEGDVIRMGCSMFRVRQLVADASTGVRPEVTLPDTSATTCYDRGSESEGSVCRICLEGGCDEQGPLLQPCACKGSIESVHLGCLQQWIRCRMGLMDEKPGNNTFVKQMDCDLCKQAYPSHVCLEGIKRPLVEVPQPTAPFIVLEKLRSKSSSPGVLVASLAGEEVLTFGRAHGVGFQLEDTSISRLHAKISFKQGHFVLEDNGSRFGTLVCMRRPYALPLGTTVSIQVGSAVVSMTLKHGASLCPCPPGTAQDHRSDCGTEEGLSG